MPETYRPLFGLDPWSGIKAPETMPYYMKRGIASLMWSENGESPRAYNARLLSSQFRKAYRIIGASLVRGDYLRRPGADGLLVLTPAGEKRQRELQKPSTKKGRERLKRARRAVKWLDMTLVKLKADLQEGVIKETDR